jgi:hypothetical protein
MHVHRIEGGQAMMRTLAIAGAVLALAIGTAAANPGGTNVVISEIMVNPAGTYDGAEYIELYNPTGAPISIAGWVLTGTEYGVYANGGGVCGGEDRWQFPTGTSVPSHGRILVAKDGGDGDDGFYEVYGFYPDFEMWDNVTNFAETNNPSVPNMIQLDFDAFSDEIQLVGGRGYGRICGTTSQSDVVYLYTSATMTTLVDLVEYKDPVLCATDPCAGDDGANDNAYPVIPYIENALGRNPAGTDTDNSDNDFTLQAATPGAPNILNTPPWIRNLVYSPIPPNSVQTTAVSAIVTDDGTVDSVGVYYREEGGSWARLVATHTPGDSLYTAQVPPYPNGTMVEYYMRAVDNNGAGMNYPAEGQSGPYAYSIGYTTIYNVQFVPDGSNQSQLKGRPVNVRGIVTAASGVYSASYFFIHEGTGQFKGVKVYAPGSTVSEGDDVTVCGKVQEYYNETEISLHFASALYVHSTGNANYGYTNVTTTAVAPGDTISSEKYEGQLIRMQNATVTQIPDSYGQWLVKDATAAAAMIDDAGYYVYEPLLNDVMTELRGILFYNYSDYKTNPRYDADIIGPPRIYSLVYSPIPPTSASAVTLTANCTDNVALTSVTLSYATNPAGPFTGVAMTAAGGGNYTKAIGPFTNGTRIYYYVTATDGTMTARKPVAGSYSFYVGLLTIHDVQYVAAGGDASPLDTLAVNVEGIVTAEPGVFGNYQFFIQSAPGAFNGVLVYDRTGTVNFQRGDHVVVCGKVQENFRETEISLHFPESAKLLTSRTTLPAPVDIATNKLQTVTTGEQYEGVLVHVKGATVKAPDIGHGEWMISNGTAADTCRVDDYGDYDYVPVLNDNIMVLGIVKFSFGNYKIEPRGNPDIAANPVGVPDDAMGRFGLLQNAPNPFNPKTTIAFSLPEANDVRLEIYDVAGRKVTTLVDERLGAGDHRVEWNGVASTGDRVASGVYFYKLTSGQDNVSKKMVLLK